jgi:hypothetical protein
MAIRMKLFVIDYSRLLSHLRRGGCERILKRLERRMETSHDDNENSAGKSPSATEQHRRTLSRNPKGIAHFAKEVSRFFLLLKFFLLSFYCNNILVARRRSEAALVRAAQPHIRRAPAIEVPNYGK